MWQQPIGFKPAFGQDIPDSQVLKRTVSSESLCIAVICLLDLVTTLYWVSQGQAKEGNPLLAYFLDQSVPHFIVAKLATFVPALVAAEWYRQHRPGLVKRLLRWVIICYLVFYIAGFAAHHGQVVEFYRHLLFG